MKFLFLILILILPGCRTSRLERKGDTKMQQSVSTQIVPGPKALVYKTRGNYNDLVPVLLSDDKSEIISYPHPSDIKINGTLQTPVQLHKGYLLDNRGIGINAGFLKLTYKEYSELEVVPNLGNLYKMLIDKDPLTEMYDCGSKSSFPDIIKQLNDIIDNNKLPSQKRLK